MKFLWLLATAVAMFLLASCGGSSTATTTDPKGCIAFINHSNQSAATLMQDWIKAQSGIANRPGVCLNAINVLVNHDPCNTVIDQRANTVWPCNLLVTSVPDDGKGSIPCPAGSGFSQCYGYSSNNSVTVAASGNGPLAISYEMENVILTALGYDTSNR